MIADAFRQGLFPAVPVPHEAGGRIDAEAHERYVEWMASQPIQGVAVWTDLGRGTKLGEEGRSFVIRAWRDGLGGGRSILAAVGPTTEERRPDLLIESAAEMARSAAEQGADCLLVLPPTLLRGARGGESPILEYHAAIAEAGLPMVVQYLNEAAGGVSYSPHVLAQLLARDDVFGIRIATLDSVMTYQQIVALVRRVAPTKLIISGEERFLGYSMMCGADAAIVGLAAACPSLLAEFVASFWQGEAARFLALNSVVDDFAQQTVLPPTQGLAGRLLCCLVHQGVLQATAAHDPWGPRIGPREFEQIGECLARIGQNDRGPDTPSRRP